MIKGGIMNIRRKDFEEFCLVDYGIKKNELIFDENRNCYKEFKFHFAYRAFCAGEKINEKS